MRQSQSQAAGLYEQINWPVITFIVCKFTSSGLDIWNKFWQPTWMTISGFVWTRVPIRKTGSKPTQPRQPTANQPRSQVSTINQLKKLQVWGVDFTSHNCVAFSALTLLLGADWSYQRCLSCWNPTEHCFLKHSNVEAMCTRQGANWRTWIAQCSWKEDTSSILTHLSMPIIHGNMKAIWGPCSGPLVPWTNKEAHRSSGMPVCTCFPGRSALHSPGPGAEQGQNILLPVVWSAAALKGPPNWDYWCLMAPNNCRL